MIYEGKAITVKALEGGIVELNFDLKGESVNKFNRLTLNELRAAVDAIKADASVKGVIVSSGKDVFIVGADITEFVDNFKLPDEELVAGNLEANKIFNDFEDLPVPTVVAINGIALGGGFEMCLAADYRVAAESAKVGLPEVKLGIYPGFGGTVRLPRVIRVSMLVASLDATSGSVIAKHDRISPDSNGASHTAFRSSEQPHCTSTSMFPVSGAIAKEHVAGAQENPAHDLAQWSILDVGQSSPHTPTNPKKKAETGSTNRQPGPWV